MNGDRDCVVYAEHLHAEQRELHRRLRALQQELGEVTQPYLDRPLLARILEAGRELREELAHHFAEEESGGCLDYAVSRMPRLAGEAQLVENEHPVLLEELDAMLARLCLARPGELETATVKERFDAFVVRMLTHEARENQLVERGFNMAFDDE
jgi:hypothetical protein